MAAVTRIDVRSFRGIMRSKVLGLPLPLVAAGVGVLGVWWWRRNKAREAPAGEAVPGEVAPSDMGTDFAADAGGGGVQGFGGAGEGASSFGVGGFGLVPYPTSVPRPIRVRIRQPSVRRVVAHRRTVVRQKGEPRKVRTTTIRKTIRREEPRRRTHALGPPTART